MSAWEAIEKRADVLGAIVNVRNYHWTCLCKESGLVFYVDSRYAPVAANFASLLFAMLRSASVSFKIVSLSERMLLTTVGDSSLLPSFL